MGAGYYAEAETPRDTNTMTPEEIVEKLISEIKVHRELIEEIKVHRELIEEDMQQIARLQRDICKLNDLIANKKKLMEPYLFNEDKMEK